MKPEPFSELARRGVLYVYPATTGIVTARGGVEKNGAHWLLCGDGFHVLPVANLTERQFSGGVTWEDGNGLPAFTLMEETACEEINPAEAERERAEVFDGTTTPWGREWYRQNIAGAASAGPEHMTWKKPRAASDAPP